MSLQQRQSEEFVRQCVEWWSDRGVRKTVLHGLDHGHCCHLFSYYKPAAAHAYSLSSTPEARASWKKLYSYKTERGLRKWLEIQIAIFNVTETIHGTV